jgi:hypothetical protein
VVYVFYKTALFWCMFSRVLQAVVVRQTLRLQAHTLDVCVCVCVCVCTHMSEYARVLDA